MFNPPFPQQGIDLKDVLRVFEHFYITEALRRTSGNTGKAAAMLGLNRTTLVMKMKQHGLIQPKGEKRDEEKQAP